MTVSQKLTALAEGMPKIYAAGQKDSPLRYGARPEGLFWGAVFPEGYVLTVEMPNVIPAQGIYEMFRAAKGLEGLTLVIPTAEPYNARHFLYLCSAIRWVQLPEGIRFSNFEAFAGSCSALEEIRGSIDLSASSNNSGCFSSCSRLREVRFLPGSIGLNISFKQSGALSAASVASIVEGLAQVETPQILSLHDTVKNALTDTQRATVTAKNWTIE